MLRRNALRLSLAMGLLLAMLGPVQERLALAIDYAWTSYNDCCGTTGGNTTAYSYTGTTAGLLKVYETGANTAVTVTITKNGSVTQNTSHGAYSAEGTDAYIAFHDKANMVGVNNYASSTGWYYDLTFTGLDPAKAYTFATTANRDNSGYGDRVSQFTISDVEAATNSSTDGVTVVSNESVAFCTGYNTENGYVARWTGIQPGADGDFAVRINAYPFDTAHYGYGPSVFMLAEEGTPGPTISTSGTLLPFHSEPGTPSDYQTYTVSGINLTNDIDISAPGGFELATASGGAYSSLLTLPQVGGTVASTTIYVRLTGAAEGSFGGNIAHVSSGATQKNVPVSGTVAGPNEAPEQPVLVRPANGGTGVSLPPTLEVTVTDPDEDEMCVTFYGREAGAGGGEDFALIVYPDTQGMAASATYAAAFNSMSQYVVDNMTALNIAFVTHVGDIVNTSSSTAEWQRADAAMDILDAAGVPYSVGPGNHDIAMGTTYYPDYFGSARFSGNSWYGGYYTGGSDNYNNYSLFSAGGMDFILINLQYQAGTGALDWADALLKTYSDRRGVVEQHDILNINDSWYNQAAYTALADNPNLFLMLCGHMHSSSDGSAYRLETRTGMDPVHILLTDYQDYPSGGNGYLRILTFKPADDEIYAQIYSPYTDAYLTNAANHEQFTMAYDMAGEAPFQQLDEVCGVASGTNASFVWTSLSQYAGYEWCVEVADGSEATTGPTWSFTTGPASASLLGDVDGNGLVNSTDALIILSADVGMSTVQFCPMNCGDVNADGLVNSTDALIVLSYDVGMGVPYLIGQASCPGSITQPPGCGGCQLETGAALRDRGKKRSSIRARMTAQAHFGRCGSASCARGAVGRA